MPKSPENDEDKSKFSFFNETFKSFICWPERKDRGFKDPAKMEAASGQRFLQMAWDFLTTPF